MKLKLERDQLLPELTHGRLYVDGAFQCYTLEDTVRPQKIAGRTAVPKGSYQVKITWSPRFKRDLPLVVNVPGFEGVRIHPGNTAEDTEGCILVGRRRFETSIADSRLAFNELFELLKRQDSVTLDIE